MKVICILSAEIGIVKTDVNLVVFVEYQLAFSLVLKA